jgi:hypothetical protein
MMSDEREDAGGGDAGGEQQQMALDKIQQVKDLVLAGVRADKEEDKGLNFSFSVADDVVAFFLGETQGDVQRAAHLMRQQIQPQGRGNNATTTTSGSKNSENKSSSDGNGDADTRREAGRLTHVTQRRNTIGGG